MHPPPTITTSAVRLMSLARTGFRVHGSGFWVRSRSGCWVLGSKFGVRSSGFGVGGSGFEVRVRARDMLFARYMVARHYRELVCWQLSNGGPRFPRSCHRRDNKAATVPKHVQRATAPRSGTLHPEQEPETPNPEPSVP